jgi:hypothetical protein
VATVAGCLVGLFGPGILRGLQRQNRVPPPPPRSTRAAFPDDLDEFYLEPAETPLH